MTQLWMKSKEVEKMLKISSCHLMHLRMDDTLRHKREGRAFYYLVDDVLNLKKVKC